MAYEFKFPDVGEGIQEGEIVKWNVKEGDKIEVDEPLGDIETDKAIVEMPSPKSGIILKLHIKEGKRVKVGEIMVTIGEKGEKIRKSKKEVEEEAKEKEAATGAVVGSLPQSEEGIKTVERKKEIKEKVLAAPAVRKLAQDLSVDLSSITPSGENDIITQDDVVKASRGEVKTVIEEKKEPKFKVERKYDFFGYITRVPLKGIRKTIAQRMKESVEKTAQVTHMDEADVNDLYNLRQNEKKEAAKKGVKLTYLPYIVKAVVEALKEHPFLNSSLEEDEIIIKKYFNIGIAVDTGEGLMVPVVKGADQKNIMQIAKEIQEYAEKAKKRKLDIMDLKGGTFTITNIGVIGGKFFTPIINYPESAILGIGKMHDKIVVDKKVSVRKTLPLSLTYDHQIADGAEAARFLNDIIKFLEDKKFLEKLK